MRSRSRTSSATKKAGARKKYKKYNQSTGRAVEGKRSSVSLPSGEMGLILAEKPSVARDIAKAFRNRQNGDNCILVNDPTLGNYVICWAAGHLYELDNGKLIPTELDKDKLPIVPQRFEYAMRKGAGKLVKTIKHWLGKVQRVVIATDAGREGELIARLILLKCGWKDWDNTYRLWTSEALTPDVVRRVLRNLKPSRDFESLYQEALARQHADWVFGINASIAARFKMGSNTSIGRVQTPVLRLIVDRYIEHKNFKPEPYWVVRVDCASNDGRFEAFFVPRGAKAVVEEADGRTDDGESQESHTRLSKEDAERILSHLKKFKTLKVVDVATKKSVQRPPLLHSLTSLQREANELYGFSADKTLKIAQVLYEKRKVLSYPRTDARHLSRSNIKLVKGILAKLGKEDLIPSVDKVGKRVFDDAKLTDHHALIPLAPAPDDLSDDEKKIYNLVWRKFVGAFMPDYVAEKTAVILETPDGAYRFRATGVKTVQLGWKQLYKQSADKELPSLNAGMEVAKLGERADKKFTQPPPLYAESAVLKLMEKLGLGTPATRSGIIEKLKQRQYVVVRRKKLIPTDKGLMLIDALKDFEFTSPEMTANWENKLHSIYKENLGYRGYKSFMEDIVSFTGQAVKDILASSLTRPQLKPSQSRRPT